MKLLWYVNIKCDIVIKARKQDLTLVDKKEHKAVIIDKAAPADVNVEEKVSGVGGEKVQHLKGEIK